MLDSAVAWEDCPILWFVCFFLFVFFIAYFYAVCLVHTSTLYICLESLL